MARGTLVSISRRILLIFTLVSISLRSIPPHGVRAASITVNSTADIIADNGWCTLREAIIASNADTPSGNTPGECAAGLGDDIIDLTELTGSIHLAGPLPNITSNIVFNGPGAEFLRVRRDSGGQYRVLTISEDAHVTISNLRISGGQPQGSGGGIYNAGTLTLDHCMLAGNQALGNGGGICNTGVLTLEHTTLIQNRGYLGGGIYNQGQMTLQQSTLTANIAESGGGIVNAITGTLALHNCILNINTAQGSPSCAGTGGGIDNRGTFTLTHSTIAGNTARDTGGGIHNEGDNATINLRASAVLSNSTRHGGGIFNVDDAVLTVINSTLSNNQAVVEEGNGGMGGGIQNLNGFVTFTQNTISRNQAAVAGGGIDNHGNFTLRNSIVANQKAGNACSGEDVISMGHNLDDDGSCNLDALGDLTAEPQLGPLQNNGGAAETHALLIGSPAFDAVPLAYCVDHQGMAITLDQRDIHRPQGNACDIGAYEAQTAELNLHVAVDNEYPAVGETFNFVVNLSNRGPLTATGIVVQDSLTSGLHPINAIPTVGIYDDNTGLWHVEHLNVSICATLTLTATVETGNAGFVLTNTANIISADQFDGNATDNNALATVSVQAPIVSFERISTTVTEGTGQSVISVTLSTPSGYPVSVCYSTLAESATAGKDYIAISGTVTLEPGEIAHPLSVPIVRDTEDEENEVFKLILSDPMHATLDENNIAMIRILDDDPKPIVSFDRKVYSVTEAKGTATLSVTLNTISGLTVTVNSITEDGSAIANTDYITSSHTLTISPGLTSTLLTVDIVDDMLAETLETLSVTLKAPDNATLGENTSALLTILDDDDVPITGLKLTVSDRIMPDQPTTFTSTITSGSNVSYAWAFGDGIVTQTWGNLNFGCTITHSYTIIGSYTVIVTASNRANTMTTTSTLLVFEPEEYFEIFIPVVLRSCNPP